MQHIISKALEEAKKAGEKGEIPIGAVIFNSLSKEILAIAANKVEELKDPTAHAELLAIKEACNKINDRRLCGYSLYVTLEPCPMCATALSFARIDEITFGAYDEKGGGIENGCKVFSTQRNLFKPKIQGGIFEPECKELLKDFFARLRTVKKENKKNNIINN